MKRWLASLLFVALPLSAAQPQSHWARAWKWSAAALLAGNAVDAASSWHQQELNPMLGSRFDGRSVGIKFGIAGGLLTAQYFIARRHPAALRTFTYTNLGVTVMLDSVAIRNAMVTR